MKKIDQLFWKSRLKYQEKLEQYLKKKEFKKIIIEMMHPIQMRDL